jgi:hypothetical protein
MTHLFYDVAHVEIRRARYDARRKIQSTEQAHLHNLAGLCLSSIEEDLEVSEAVHLQFERAMRERNSEAALAAFWVHNAPKVRLAKADARLLVNPPPGLQVPEGDVVTLSSDGGATYGKTVRRLDDPLIVRQIGYTFSEVDLFSPPSDLARDVYLRVKPLSVIAVFEPSQRNNFWMTFLGIKRSTFSPPKDLGMSLLKVFSDEVSGDVQLEVYGVESSV